MLEVTSAQVSLTLFFMKQRWTWHSITPAFTFASTVLKVGSACLEIQAVHDTIKQWIMSGLSSALQSWKDSVVLKAVAQLTICNLPGQQQSLLNDLQMHFCIWATFQRTKHLAGCYVVCRNSTLLVKGFVTGGFRSVFGKLGTSST